MDQKHQRPGPEFGDVHFDAVGLDKAVGDRVRIKTGHLSRCETEAGNPRHTAPSQIHGRYYT